MSEILSNYKPEELIDANKTVIEEIVRTVYLDFAGPNKTKDSIEEYKGEIRGVKYRSRHPFKSGKQQPVVIVTLNFQTGEEFDIVLKRDTDGTLQKQQNSVVLQEIFPKIFLETEQIAAIEFIDGLELEPFKEFIKDPKVFARFLEDAFESFDKISGSEFEFQDIDFATGHNFIYDKELNKFRAFDIHSIQESKKTYEEKLISFIESELKHTHITSGKIKLFMFFIQKFLVKYPDRKLQFTGREKMTLKSGDAGYEERWKNFEKNCGWFIANKIPIDTEEIEGIFVLNQEILDAAIKDDEAAFLAAYHANNDHLYNLVP